MARVLIAAIIALVGIAQHVCLATDVSMATTTSVAASTTSSSALCLLIEAAVIAQATFNKTMTNNCFDTTLNCTQ
jgi:hypothetical protein